jgi:anti-sigma-K factor RskA
MDAREYIESGILELYVYGLLSEDENRDVNRMAMQYGEINNEIVAIEKSVINLSTSFSPYLSLENFEKIRGQLELKYGKTVEMKPERRSSVAAFIGWAAAVVFLAGAGYLYMQLNESNTEIVNIETERAKLKEDVQKLETRATNSETALAIVRDKNNLAVPLAGQTAAPDAYAKIYWNRDTQAVYVDAAGLPEPPEGMVYQIWSIKLKPALAPTSIGLLENFTASSYKVFTVSGTPDAEAFGITLEPAGGSATPTMEQLYTLGVVKA